jgi:hypothetical protein
MTSNRFQKERSNFLKSAERSFDKYTEENGQAPVATGIINVNESGDSKSSWLTHQPNLTDAGSILAKGAALDFTTAIQNKEIDMVDASSYGGGEDDTTTSRSREGVRD